MEIDSMADANRDAFRARVRRFASEVGKRHRRERGDLAAMFVALRGWHAAWKLCSPDPVPPLDDEAIAVAIKAHEQAVAMRRYRAAA